MDADATKNTVCIDTGYENTGYVILNSFLISRYKRIKKKGYARIVTNKGPLNLELHCDAVPKTCENFIKLAQKGYYNDTIFHRSIKNFMIQGEY